VRLIEDDLADGQHSQLFAHRARLKRAEGLEACPHGDAAGFLLSLKAGGAA